MAGTSGSTGERFSPLTASARSLPALMCASAEGRLANTIGNCPPSTSLMAGATPLYGTCCSEMPPMLLSISPSRWLSVPLPAEAYW
ncbi:hypothetical protein D3C72_1449310 [compost metagenome]